MSDDEIFCGDEELTARIYEAVCSSVKVTLDNVTSVWKNLGITKADAVQRIERLEDFFTSNCETVSKSEYRIEQDAIKINEDMGREIDELYEELRVDTDVNHANIQPDDTIFVLKEKLERELARLMALKDAMLEDIRLLKADEEVLCDEMDIPKLSISEDRVPQGNEKKELEDQVKFLKLEKIKRRNEFSDIRAQVVALWAELGARPADAFEEVVADETMRLTKENLLGVKNLKNQLESRVKALTDDYEAKKHELELLWSRLDVSQDYAASFSLKHFGIKPDNFRHMDIELEQRRAEKAEKIGQFIENVAREILEIAKEMMFGPKDLEELEVTLSTSDHSQETLDRLEAKAKKMGEELEAKSNLLKKIKKWNQCLDDFRRLTKAENDPAKYSNRGGALLQRGKELTRLKKVVPELYAKLKQEVQSYEEQHGEEFRIEDARFLTILDVNFTETGMGEKPRVPLSSQTKMKKPEVVPGHGFKSNTGTKQLKRKGDDSMDGSISKQPRLVASASKALPDTTLDSVPDYTTFRCNIASAHKSGQKRRSPRHHNRLQNHPISGIARPGFTRPLNEIHPVSSTQLESPSPVKTAPYRKKF